MTSSPSNATSLNGTASPHSTTSRPTLHRFFPNKPARHQNPAPVLVGPTTVQPTNADQPAGTSAPLASETASDEPESAAGQSADIPTTPPTPAEPNTASRGNQAQADQPSTPNVPAVGPVASVENDPSGNWVVVVKPGAALDDGGHFGSASGDWNPADSDHGSGGRGGGGGGGRGTRGAASGGGQGAAQASGGSGQSHPDQASGNAKAGQSTPDDRVLVTNDGRVIHFAGGGAAGSQSPNIPTAGEEQAPGQATWATMGQC